ncbi:phosphate acyltransferase [Enterococcus casseliflavus]
MKELENKAVNNKMKIMFVEGENENIIKAAAKSLKREVCTPMLVGRYEVILDTCTKLGINCSDFTIVNSDLYDTESWVEEFYSENTIYSKKKLTRLLKNPLYFSMMALKYNKCEGVIGGIDYTTSEVVMAGQIILGLEDNVSTVSSYFIMDIPNYQSKVGSLIVLSDGGVCVDPTSEELGDIALTTAKSVKQILGWEPRVAFLSYSTDGSGMSEQTNKIVEALEYSKKKAPNLCVDGEFQLDAAISPEVASKKVKRKSSVAGQANILILPDLNSGNILYKGIQRFAGAKAYGPLLQGFKKPLYDLSRGSSVEDIYGVIVIMSSSFI